MDASGRAAIAILSVVPQNKADPTENGFRWVEIPGKRIYSCYWTPICPIAEYSDFLQRLELSIRSSALPVVVVGTDSHGR